MTNNVKRYFRGEIKYLTNVFEGATLLVVKKEVREKIRSFRVTKGELHDIDKLCTQIGMSRSFLIRQLFKDYIKEKLCEISDKDIGVPSSKKSPTTFGSE